MRTTRIIGVDFADGRANADCRVRCRFAPRAQLVRVHPEHPVLSSRLQTDSLVRS